jgi:hypothetical protein
MAKSIFFVNPPPEISGPSVSTRSRQAFNKVLTIDNESSVEWRAEKSFDHFQKISS